MSNPLSFERPASPLELDWLLTDVRDYCFTGLAPVVTFERDIYAPDRSSISITDVRAVGSLPNLANFTSVAARDPSGDILLEINIDPDSWVVSYDCPQQTDPRNKAFNTGVMMLSNFAQELPSTTAASEAFDTLARNALKAALTYPELPVVTEGIQDFAASSPTSHSLSAERPPVEIGELGFFIATYTEAYGLPGVENTAEISFDNPNRKTFTDVIVSHQTGCPPTAQYLMTVRGTPFDRRYEITAGEAHRALYIVETLMQEYHQ